MKWLITTCVSEVYTYVHLVFACRQMFGSMYMCHYGTSIPGTS